MSVLHRRNFDSFLGHGTASGKYRPEFLDHFDQKEKDNTSNSNHETPNKAENSVPEVDSPAGQALQKQLQQIAGGQPVLQNVASASANNPSKFQQCIAEGDLEFVSHFAIYVFFIKTCV